LSGNWKHRFEVFDFPYLGGVVGTTGREVLDVGREKDAGDVVAVRLEVGNWDQGCLLAVLEEMPDVNVALYTSVQPIGRHRFETKEKK